MTQAEKAVWHTPKLASLDVTQTLGGTVNNFSETEIFTFNDGRPDETGGS